MSATTQLMTADELLLLPRGEFRYELLKGELKKMAPAGFEHGVVIVRLTSRLAQHIEANDLGVVCGAETGFKIAHDPDTVRAPDIGFVTHERISQIGITKKYFPGAPDLAVEVLSPGDTAEEIDEKVDQWLLAGAHAVWVVSPERRTVKVHHSLNDITLLTEADELDGGDVVKGFRCRVGEIFI